MGFLERLRQSKRAAARAPAAAPPAPATAPTAGSLLLERLRARLRETAPAVPAVAVERKQDRYLPPSMRPAAAPARSRFESLEYKPEPRVSKLERSAVGDLFAGRQPIRNAGHGVQRCFEFDRIFRLARRQLDLTIDLTDEFLVPGSTAKLKPIQSAALHEARQMNGLIAPVGAGEGKTLISLLLPFVLESRRAVLLVPPQLRYQLEEQDIPYWSKHFRFPKEPRLTIVSYSMLSSAKHAGVLDQIRPDLIIADEAHNLRHRTAARTKRFLRYFKEHPGTRLAALSGTLTTRSLRDYPHLIELALGKSSPVPHWQRSYSSLMEWAEALDVVKDKSMGARSPGILLEFCSAEEKTEIAMNTGRPVQEVVREGFRRRLIESPGVTATQVDSVGASLVFVKRELEIPATITSALAKLRKSWSIGDEILEEAPAMWRVARQLATGFFYVWAWPNGEKDEDWLRARKAWHQEVREYLRMRARPGMDSPKLLENAAKRGDWDSHAWPEWELLKQRDQPPTKPIWLDDFMVRDCVKYVVDAKEPVILWYEHDALGVALAEAIPTSVFCGPGEDSAQRISRAAEEGRSIIASIRAHGTGKNLQAFSKQLITTPPANGTTAEQLVARSHRPGQEADVVVVDMFLHTEEYLDAWEAAKQDAEYQQQTTGKRQKILYGSRIGVP